MRRQRKLFLYGLILIILLFCASYIFCSCVKKESSGLLWEKEESYFVDYWIEEDTVYFCYAFSFNNLTDKNLSISSAANASFEKQELKEWVQYEKFYTGHATAQKDALIVGPGEQIIVKYVFEGKYLGGVVNTGLSVPHKFIASFSVVKTEVGEEQGNDTSLP